MRRLILPLALCALALLWAAPAAQAEFGFEHLAVSFTNQDGSPATQAGSHPFQMATDFNVNTKEDPVFGEVPDGSVKDVIVDLPAGLAGDPTAVPRCSNADFLIVFLNNVSACPDNSAIGFVSVHSPGEEGGDLAPLYHLNPPPGAAAKIGFHALGVAVTIEFGVRPEPEYNVFADVTNVSQAEPVSGSEVLVWGVPADPAHDSERGSCFGPGSETCPTDAQERPFLTLPRRCDGPLITTFSMRSWQEPDVWVSESVLTEDEFGNPIGTTGCGKVGFGPRISSQPTTDQVESPTGLSFDLRIDDEGLTNPDGIAQSDIEAAEVALPEGMTINPSVAEGLATCSPAQLQGEQADSGPGAGCPQAAKVGEVTVKTPLLAETLQGDVFVATQDDPATPTPGAENPFDSLIALYMVIKNAERGILVRQAGLVEPDPTTGQLVSLFEEIPQFPFSDFNFHFRSGGRSPLITPPTCATYTTEALFGPWANPGELFAATSDFQISRGLGGGPCPTGLPPFIPDLEAGTLSNAAGSHSPFYLRLIRRDADQDLTKFGIALPPGLLGKLAGVEKCSDQAIAQAKAKSGKAELASPSCPANSQIGRTNAGAGVGSQLTYVPGKLYLAGPVGKAPLSVVAIVPAVAGPFDAGTVVVRVALDLNPQTAQVEVDGSSSDPIPHILKGIPLKVKDVRVHVDRANFTLNPTNCDPKQIAATLFGSGADIFNPVDDGPVPLSERFQAASCDSLGFKPKLNLALKGSTKRGGHPALKAIVRPRPGDANFKRAVVTLPRSAFLDQAHIRTICTRVQFAQNACPAGSIYGKAKAITPLLDEALEGPVYLRSSNHKLPDLVAVLKGIVEVELVGRIDSHKGGIRSTFEAIPDAPVSSFVLQMQGGKKGLIVNSRDLCERRSKAKARLMGQNGRRHDFGVVVRALGCKGK